MILVKMSVSIKLVRTGYLNWTYASVLDISSLKRTSRLLRSFWIIFNIIRNWNLLSC